MTCVFALTACGPIPTEFPDPFAGDVPGALVQAAADAVQAGLPNASDNDEGKMFGVLVVRTREGELGYVKAFSGMLNGSWHAAGFVPPVFDETARAQFEHEGAVLVARLQQQAKAFEQDCRWLELQRDYAQLCELQTEQLREVKARQQANKRARHEQREAVLQLPSAQREQVLFELAQQSRADKAELKRVEAVHAAPLQTLQQSLNRCARRHRAHLRLLHMVCRHLMRRIHDCYVIANARGESSSLRGLFAPAQPPSGAADCAAPKLLAYAYAHGLQPLALGEFWWGPPPPAGIRKSGVFYPACKGKCGPLLPFMLQGLPAQRQGVARMRQQAALEVVYEDAFVVVVNKPAGLLSVPGRGPNKDDSVLTRLRFWLPKSSPPFLVHRLDQDTSGLLLAAKSQAAYVILQRQFSLRQVHKRYLACLDGAVKADGGTVELPLRLDLDDRPRQVVDRVNGKPAFTRFTVLRREAGRTWVQLFPATGRTHQLRVHCAHPLGLNAPIVGDPLYGARGQRMYLHAEELGFAHPLTCVWRVFSSPAPF